MTRWFTKGSTPLRSFGTAAPLFPWAGTGGAEKGPIFMEGA